MKNEVKAHAFFIVSTTEFRANYMFNTNYTKMKKILLFTFTVLSLSSCTVSYMNTKDLRENYEEKINNTKFLGRVLFKKDVKKKDVYDNIDVYLNEKEVKKNFEVIAYGQYTPLVIPIIRPERPRLEKNLLWKAAQKARKLKADATIIDDKNHFRIIKYKAE